MNGIDWRHLEAHPYADIFPRLDGDALRGLIDDIVQHGLREPVTLYQGMVLDGRNRLAACREAGVTPTFRQAQATTDEEALREALSLNLHRRHLTTSQRARIAADVEPMFAEAAKQRQGTRTDIKVNLPECSPRQARDDAADALNVSPSAVQHAKRVKEHAVPELDTMVRGGRVAVSRAASIATAAPEQQREIVERIESGEKPKEAEDAVRKPRVVHNSGNNEWYTPPEFLEAAREVLGGIDLDPASCEVANRNVQAATYYTQEDDGLVQDWRGRVWMNPPYAQPLCSLFTARLAEMYEAGKVTEAMTITHNSTETRWYQRMTGAASAVCLLKGRVRFLDETGDCPHGAPLQGQVITYFGPNVERFARVFSDMGLVLEVVR